MAASEKDILVVDDEDAILFAMREYFGALGYEVDTAGTAGDAVALLDNVRYRLVVADLRLSGCGDAEGLEVLQKVRDRSPETRTVLLTAYGTPGVDQEVRRRGIDLLLQKPLPLAEVARVASDLLASPATRPW